MSDGSKKGRRDTRAVAPVLGIVMMVAIAVSLGALVGLSALGVADEVADVGPNASFEYEYDYDGASWTSGDSIVITHAAGDEIRTDRLEIEIKGADTIPGEQVFDDELLTAGSTGTIEHGMSEERAASWSGDESIRIVWQGDAGETAVVSSGTIPG